MTSAALGYGTLLKMSDGGSPDTFSTIAEVKDLNDSDESEQVEVTNHSSPNSRREYIGGLIDGGEITFTCNYIPTNATQSLAAGLRSLIGSSRTFRLEEPGNTLGMEFNAVIVSCGRSYPVDNVMEMNVTLKKSGAVIEYTVA